MAEDSILLFLDQEGIQPNKTLATRHREKLQKVEQILLEIIFQDAHTKKEAKTWLITSIAKLQPSDHIPAFLTFLPLKRSHHSSLKSSEHELLHQLGLLLCESRSIAPRLAKLLSRDVDMVKRFFAEDERRVESWFKHFGGVGEEHLLGAAALARYAILHRDECWEELEWAGSHPQAPGTVAAKPHYFAELDVVHTVRNFLKHVPDFWTAQDWRDCLSCGEFLALEPEFFAKRLVKLLERGARKGSNEEQKYVQESVRMLVKDFFQEEHFSDLCRRLLHLASPDGLLCFLDELQHADVRKSARDPQLAAVADIRWRELDDAILCNACAGNGRQVVRLLREDDSADQREQLEALVADASPSEPAEFQSFRSELRTRSRASERKWLILESWLLRWRLSKVADDPQALQRVLDLNGMTYRPSFVASRELRNGSSPEKRKRRRKGGGNGKHRRKRERGSSGDSALTKYHEKQRHVHSYSGPSDNNSEESSEGERQEEAGQRESLNGKRGRGIGGEARLTLVGADGVYLETDNYAFRWSLAELPDHLSVHSLATWLGWRPSKQQAD